MNTEKSKMNQPHKFVLNLSQILDLRILNKNVASQKMLPILIYLLFVEKIRRKYKNNKLKNNCINMG